MNKSALIVIDVQQSFRHSPYWSETDLPQYLARQQALIDGCAARGVPIVQIFHVEAQGVFSLATCARSTRCRSRPTPSFTSSITARWLAPTWPRG